MLRFKAPTLSNITEMTMELEQEIHKLNSKFDIYDILEKNT